MIIVVDIDGTICFEANLPFDDMPIEEIHAVYAGLKPKKKIIETLKRLAKCNVIIFHTSRQEVDMDVTKKWLRDQGFTDFVLITDKPRGDIYIDNKAVHPDTFRRLVK